MTRSFLTSAITLGAMFVAVPAFAATMTLEQRSDVGVFGSWTITPPTGNLIRSNSREERRTINNLSEGMYTLRIATPQGATTTIRLSENGVIRESVTDDLLTFTLNASSVVTLQIAYTYQGMITVESIPLGAPFEISGHNGIRYTGVTPMTFRELPPAYYSANFGLRTGCTIPRPIKRDLGANEEVIFLGEYRCGSASLTAFSSKSIASSVSSSNSSQQASARVIHTLQQNETLPGGSIRVTVGMVNTSRTTLRNLTISEQFDPSVIAIDTLPAGAMRQGNYIIWHIPSIFAGQRWSEDMIVHVSSNAKIGTTALTARLAGDALDGTPQEQLASTVNLGVATLPATGGAFDIVVALFGLLLPAPALLTLRRR
ncbi:MAG: hypothetical protein Greene041662_1073 [Candidatus Peregrinibacteria bacterium Greene0416_62]|nr:MAG: hypothetical protein Greene041662_1073 [Candidatus Peregrinibacteria bacterium Greene0416_62]